jgi:hypothetical protein
LHPSTPGIAKDHNIEKYSSRLAIDLDGNRRLAVLLHPSTFPASPKTIEKYSSRLAIDLDGDRRTADFALHPSTLVCGSRRALLLRQNGWDQEATLLALEKDQ